MSEKIKEGLNKLKEKVAGVVEDLASLEVTTYSGEFTVSVANIKEVGDDVFKIKSLLKDNLVTLNSKLSLVAYTRFEIDADSSNIVSNNLNNNNKMLLEAHNEMVKAGLEARKAMIQLVKDLI